MFDHTTVKNLLNSIIPITRFNKGEANKIFEEVHQDGIKIVVKNNKPACVLISPEEYNEIVEMIENYNLLMEAEKRLSSTDFTNVKSHSLVMESLGIDTKELLDIEVEIE
ncbi:type II toxin-antitoxin system Phd/YefM family antitoxin [Acidaminobacter sp.]|uniref:type II toxin-antitoxin system Phd/YefM family antitoxin n=1 Tax=Acidaminobacter sp. TaxID=1872102 RepID=UPI001382E4B9|nr:type II toxin-antitoxin system Phd/YefM family antitoxin [Acidaminobacter sp.]MDK9712360.1 type II toxin-antitoxin system Phd/YefM family antitoxin [Acidaminobacter sp.]MZQ97602.1 type II toxin-antitoxin system Phd/YefM family antitoxin [Acidaminobacter sp.]